jgi:hypothetical protein
MSRPYSLSTKAPLAPTHPLHWTRFWPDLQRVHRSRAEARQDLILWVANLYHGTIRCGKPLGFCTVQVELTKLRDWVRDYRPALDYFFDVDQLGFHLDDENRELTTLIPKRLKPEELSVIDQAAHDLRYTPPPHPEVSTISKVYLQPGLDRKSLVERTLLAGRPELIPQLTWLLKQNTELNFHFIPSGKLKQRDTSVWPISGIETWPSWLREELFGPGIDLDSAYVQFLLQHVRASYADRPHMVDLTFPDLVRLLNDKETFRKELCEQVLQRPYTVQWKGVIKSVIMSLANGSKISAGLLTAGSKYSQTARIINDAAPEATLSELTAIGNRLKIIADQFSSARKRACMWHMKKVPTRQNVKQIFGEYFQWERVARYAIWKAIGEQGIMVHDGIDGVPADEIARLPELIETLGLRLTA